MGCLLLCASQDKRIIKASFDMIKNRAISLKRSRLVLTRYFLLFQRIPTTAPPTVKQLGGEVVEVTLALYSRGHNAESEIELVIQSSCSVTLDISFVYAEHFEEFTFQPFRDYRHRNSRFVKSQFKFSFSTPLSIPSSQRPSYVNSELLELYTNYIYHIDTISGVLKESREENDPSI